MNTKISATFVAKLFSKIANNPALIEKIEAIIDDVFLTVKAGLSLTQRITLGNYDWKNDSINESNFPHDPTTVGEWEYRLIHPNRNISSEDAKTLCESDGWQAAKLEHLLAFGEAFPEEQKRFPIVALGSVCELGGYRHVAELWYSDDKRRLVLNYWYGDWSSPSVASFLYASSLLLDFLIDSIWTLCPFDPFHESEEGFCFV